MSDTLITWLASNLVLLSAIGGGLFAFVKWLSERREARNERRTREYWELLDVALGAGTSDQQRKKMAHQVAAIHMLCRYPEFSDITHKVLKREIDDATPWAENFMNDLNIVLNNAKPEMQR